mmetsp:Transcript_17965/g.49830  ORF Transcript_17965/g.49830 Transcript_17965/m.49830 type:complete len:87 (+) Transcript_17965:89-349(+)
MSRSTCPIITPVTYPRDIIDAAAEVAWIRLSMTPFCSHLSSLACIHLPIGLPRSPRQRKRHWFANSDFLTTSTTYAVARSLGEQGI